MTSDLTRHFAELTQLLSDTQAYWRAMAFYGTDLPWLASHRNLAQTLLALPRSEVERMAIDAGALSAFLGNYLPFAARLHQLAELERLPARPLPHISPHFHTGVPGRKWAQVTAFASCVEVSRPLLEWCAGKSYLGFYLQHLHDRPVTALEWDDALVTAANTRSARKAVELRSHPVDVLDAAVEAFFAEDQQVVALHACGMLHERLLQLSVRHRVAELHLAPCCYHKRALPWYEPLSGQGRLTGLRLNQRELHTAVMEIATASAGMQRQRQRLQAMRLGFDELQCHLRGGDGYLPVPSLPAYWARADFASFCQHCAALRGIALPAGVDWAGFEALGEQRFWRVAALDLVRLLFRRPLEVWLALDRALLLQEHGYTVRLGCFCPSAITPRNVLLQAWRGDK